MEQTQVEKVEVTVIDKVQEVALRSGVEFELDITEVYQLAEKAKAITSVDDENFVAVKKECQQKRKYITEYFEDARKEVNRISKGIKGVQDLVLNEFVPEENRLKEMDKAEKDRLIMEERKKVMPARMERLANIGGEEVLPEEWIGTVEGYVETMGDADFELYVVDCQSKKNEADRIALEEEKARIAAENEAKERELAEKKAEADRIEAAREEERRIAEERIQQEKDRMEREKKEAVERAEREKAEAEERRLAAIRKEEAEKARIAQEEADRVAVEKKAAEDAEKARIAAAEAKAADEKYQAWVSGLGEGEFKFITLEDGSVEAYKLMSVYNAKS